MTQYKHIKDIRKRMKDFSVLAMGGECQICGYSACNAALEFHHINPNEKDFDFRSIKSWGLMCDELEKCILLCCRCHREIHYNVVDIPESFAKLDREMINRLRKEFDLESRKRSSIARLSTLKYSEDEKNELLRMVEAGLSTRQIAPIIGVSQSNVSYRMRKYGISTTYSR